MEKVEAYLDRQRFKPYYQLMLQTHEWIISAIPHVRYSIKYKVPFYSLNRDLFYLNPHKDHFYIGFIKGHLLAAKSHLDLSSTKQIGKYVIMEEKDLIDGRFESLVMEAVLIDDPHFLSGLHDNISG